MHTYFISILYFLSYSCLFSANIALRRSDKFWGHNFWKIDQQIKTNLTAMWSWLLGKFFSGVSNHKLRGCCACYQVNLYNFHHVMNKFAKEDAKMSSAPPGPAWVCRWCWVSESSEMALVCLLRVLLMMGVLFCCGAGFFIRRRMYPSPLRDEPAFNVSFTRHPVTTPGKVGITNERWQTCQI